MDLQPPSVLAQLPRPLHASTGKIHIGEVYSLADLKKRKRYEVIVAVDGEAVNIYNIQTPKLATSYAVPPQSSFSCRPLSVRRKLSNKLAIRRQTYVAVSRPELQVKCFIEQSGAGGASGPAISSSAFSVKDSNSPTVFLGTVSSGVEKNEDEEDETPFDILAVHKDGRVRRLAPDLETQRWSVRHSEIAKVGRGYEVHSCFLVEFDDVKKSLFKRRQDLLALALSDVASSGEEPSVLLVVSHPTGTDPIKSQDVKVHIFSVPAHARSDGLVLDDGQKLRHLLTVSLPNLDNQRTFKRDGMQWNLHAGSAGLSLSFEKGFINFDLSQYSPAVTSQFILEDERFSSIMRISAQSVIGAGKSIIALYDTRFQSVLRSIAVEDVLSGGASGTDDSKTPMTFLGYFAKLGVVVATKGSSLLAFDIDSSTSGSRSSLKRQRDGLLVDAIGRGIGLSTEIWGAVSKRQRTEDNTVLSLGSSEQADTWPQFVKELGEAIKSKDGAAFDRAMKAYFSPCDGPNGLPSAEHFFNPELILFLLSKIFSLKETRDKDVTPSSQPSITLWPENTCNWLIELGQFSMNSVEVALRRSSKPRILPPFQTGSFAQALIEADPSSRRLIQVLQGPVILDVSEIAYSLKLFLNMARSAIVEEPAAAAAISNGIVDEYQDIYSNNTNYADKSLTTKSKSSSEPSLTNVFTGLNVALGKLHSHPIASITKALRSNLSRTEIISILHHLRLCLATGGYTSRFTEHPPTPVSPDQISPPLSLDTITDLLIASVDSIGPSGWISAASLTDIAGITAAQEFDLIGEMKSEISAALAGVEEAMYLKGILREYIRFGEKVVSSSNKDGDDNASATATDGASMNVAETSTTTAQVTVQTPIPKIRHERLNGADLIVFSAPSDGTDSYYYNSNEDEADARNKMLPLSLTPPSAATDVSKTKVKKSTGEVKQRSTREIGYLRRKAVGKYSFERLIV